MKKVVILLFLCSCFFITGCSIKKVEKLTDAERFAKEYNISKNNPFIFVKYEEVINIFTNKKAIILLADSDEETSVKAAEIINRVAKDSKIEKIYYYNPKQIKEKQQKKYKKLVNIIGKSIDNYDRTIPTLYAVDHGKIVNYCNHFSKKEQLSEEYLTKKQLKKIRNDYLNVLNYQTKEKNKEEKQKKE